MLTEFHIGLDDTDSRQGGCTTYTAALIFEELLHENITPTDYPWLVRLNPNIPWKTRGNGALAIHLLTSTDNIDRVRQIVIRIIQQTSDLTTPGTDPAAVFLQGPIPDELRRFCDRALREVLTVKAAEKLAHSFGVEVCTLKGRRGIIGALAALGYNNDRDHTYEIIAYRARENLGKPRRVNLESIKRMDEKRELRTFNNVDSETGRVLTCPHGPDPVLIGIRGEDPTSLISAYQMVRLEEPVERVMTFKTNQGTDAHFDRPTLIRDTAPHQSVVVTGKVATPPKTLRGGHVFFELEDSTGTIDCAAYEPTGHFRGIIRKLTPDDTVKAYGGIRRGPQEQLTINLEKLEVLRLAEDVHYLRPRCESCGSSAESMGKSQGFRCRKCRRRFPKGTLVRIVRPRQLQETTYLPPPRAYRHLTKPDQRNWSRV